MLVFTTKYQALVTVNSSIHFIIFQYFLTLNIYIETNSLLLHMIKIFTEIGF